MWEAQNTAIPQAAKTIEDSKLNFISDFVHEYKKENFKTNREMDIKITTGLMNSAAKSMRELSTRNHIKKS